MPQKLFMHKNTIVAQLSISASNTNVNNVTVIDKTLFPYTCDSDINSMRRWLLNRKTAINRKDILPLTRFYGESYFVSENLSSLYDCYWIKEKNDETTWEEISPYQITDFENDSIFLAILNPYQFEKFEQNSPNLTLSQKQPIFWYLSEEKDVRGFLNLDAQLDMNLWKHAKELNLDIVKERTYRIVCSRICTFSESMTNENIEKIPFHQLFLSTYDKSKSKKENLVACCTHYNIPNWKHFMNQVIQFNQDTTTPIDIMDIGVLRDANTLTYIGFDKV